MTTRNYSRQENFRLVVPCPAVVSGAYGLE